MSDAGAICFVLEGAVITLALFYVGWTIRDAVRIVRGAKTVELLIALDAKQKEGK